MYSRKKGASGSTKPPWTSVPSWISHSTEDIEETIKKLAKEGYQSAKIGQVLRDQHGVPDTKQITGKKISDIMKANKLYSNYPEDLLNLIKRAVNLRKHLKKNSKDLEKALQVRLHPCSN